MFTTLSYQYSNKGGIKTKEMKEIKKEGEQKAKHADPCKMVFKSQGESFEGR